MNSSNITPEMQEAARSEIQRRQSLRESAISELNRRKNQIPNASQIDTSKIPGIGIANVLASSLQNTGSPKDILMSRLGAAKRGALDVGQGINQLGLSALQRIGSVPEGTVENYTGNKDLERLQYEQSPGSQDMISKLIRGGVSNAPYLALGPGGEAGFAAKLLRGALGGAGIGASQYAGEDQSRLANAIGGAAIGAAVPAVGSAVSGLKNALSDIPGSIDSIKKLNPLNLTNKNISKDILDTRNQNISRYTDLYDDLFKKAKDNDVYNSYFLKQASKDINFPALDKYTPSKKLSAVNDFINNPNVETAHMAKSDLQKIVKDLNMKTSLIGGEKKQYQAAKDAIDKIDNSMFKDDFGNINQELSDRYKTISSGYKREVGPYKDKNIIKFMNQEISPSELVRALSKGKFMAQRGEDHPELAMRKLVKPYGTAILGGSTALGLGDLLAHLYNKST